MMMSLCVTSFANDLAEDEEIRGDFIYEKGTNNILAYVGTSDICEIPENSNLLGLNHIKQTHTAIKKLIINKNVNFSILNSSSSLEEIDFKDGITEIPDGIMQECDSLNKIVFPFISYDMGTVLESAFSNEIVREIVSNTSFGSSNKTNFPLHFKSLISFSQSI